MDWYYGGECWWNVTENGMSLIIECHTNELSFNMKWQTKWNITQNEMSLKLECHTK